MVAADKATWIFGPIAERAPYAVRCVDPSHVAMFATEARDDGRRDVWDEARRRAPSSSPATSKAAGSRSGGPGGPGQPPASEARQGRSRPTPTYLAYLLREQLRRIYCLPAHPAAQLLDRWLAWARRCRLASLAKFARTITEQCDGILAAAIQRPDRADQHPNQ
jgi:transposase